MMKTKQLNVDETASELANIIQAQLKQGKKVLWLISGGSSVPIAVRASNLMKPSTNLLITLVDDYRSNDRENGKNYQDLRANGFVMDIFEMLTERALLDSASQNLNAWLQVQLAEVDMSIGQFGLGAGYHTGGIQPKSNEAKIEDALAAAYVLDDVEHLTITPALIRKLDVAFINSMGESKRPLVQHFLESKAIIYDEPTQALKTAKKTYLCTDVI